MNDDYFRADGSTQAFMRELVEREAAVRAPRFGLGRREFLSGTMGALAALSVIQQASRFRSRAEAQDGFVSPTEDCYAELAATHATFTSLASTTKLDWQIIQAAAHVQQRAVPEIVIGMLRVVETLSAGFGVTQLVHMTQTATRARRANASDELVLVALIHDIGKVISNANHPEIAGALARPYVSDDAYRSLRHHMEFQWQHYGDKLGLPTDLRERYVDQPWYEQTARFTDEWDQTSFDPEYASLPLEEFEPLIRSRFGRTPESRNRTADDCLA